MLNEALLNLLGNRQAHKWQFKITSAFISRSITHRNAYKKALPTYLSKYDGMKIRVTMIL